MLAPFVPLERSESLMNGSHSVIVTRELETSNAENTSANLPSLLSPRFCTRLFIIHDSVRTTAGPLSAAPVGVDGTLICINYYSGVAQLTKTLRASGSFPRFRSHPVHHLLALLPPRAK